MKKFLSNIFRIKEWLDLDRTRKNMKYVESLLYYLLHPSELKNRKDQNFDKMVLKYNLKDDDLKKNKSIFLNLTVIFLVVTLGVWAYLVFNLLQGSYWICMTIFCVSLVPLSLVFRFYYYYSVLKHKNLNLPVKKIIERK